jgi:hypothetical protein
MVLAPYSSPASSPLVVEVPAGGSTDLILMVK